MNLGDEYFNNNYAIIFENKNNMDLGTNVVLLKHLEIRIKQRTFIHVASMCLQRFLSIAVEGMKHLGWETIIYSTGQCFYPSK